MPSTIPYIPSRYYALLCERLAALGLDLPGLLRDSGIPTATLYSPDGQLRPEQIDTLVNLAITRSGRTSLALELGLSLKLSSHDVLGYAMLGSPTVDAAYRLASRYFGLMTPTCELRYRCGERQAELEVLPRMGLSETAMEFHVEVISVAAYEHVRVLLDGAPPPCRLSFAGKAPAHAARYESLSGAVVRFGERTQPGALLLLDRELVMRPLKMSDPAALKLAEARCAELMQRTARDARLGEWTRMMLRQPRQGQPTLDELAAILNLTRRTFERRLSIEGLSFRDLARAARHERACRLLEAGRLSVTQIAYELGYSDVANFTRAFRREAGRAPTDHLRALHREAG